MSFPQYDEKLVSSVRQVLLESASGKSTVKFEGLIQTLETNVATRAKIYYAISACASYINQLAHAKLIDHLFKFNLFNSHEEIIMCYCELLKHLNGAHGAFYLSRTFNHMVSFFKPPPNGEVHEEVVKRVEPYVHDLLRDLMSIPGAPLKLSVELSDRYPFYMEEANVHVPYVRNLLIIVKNNKILTESIFHILINRLIQIDVHISADFQQQDEQETEQFQMDGPNASARVDPLVEQSKQFATKIDILIDMILNFISVCDTEHQDAIFYVLLQTFEQYIICTHKSKYSQFIIFYMCALKESYLNDFMAILLKYLEPQNGTKLSLSLQSTAAYYLGSFIGRATFIKGETILKILEHFYWQMTRYVNVFGGDFPDVDKHGLFYSICQSYLYIIVFKHKVIMSTGHSATCVACLDSILKSKINPLLLLATTDILPEFSNICHSLGVLPDLNSIIYQNTSIILPARGAYGGENKIEYFFPFDPYLMKKSFTHFTHSYLIWENLNSEIEVSDSEYNDSYHSNNNSYSEQFYASSPYNFDTDDKNDFRLAQKNLASSLDMEFISPMKANDFVSFSSVTNLNEYF